MSDILSFIDLMPSLIVFYSYYRPRHLMPSRKDCPAISVPPPAEPFCRLSTERPLRAHDEPTESQRTTR